MGSVLMSPMVTIQEGKDYFFEDDPRLPYKLVRNLGHGHSAIVEMVEDISTGSVYARKVFAINGSRSERRRVFDNEIQIIRRLAPHHHVIRVIATYVAKREVGLILYPVADSGDLAAFLQDYIELETTGMVQSEKTHILQSCFGCLASSLAFMHSQKIRHKDIKPQNILVHKGVMIYTDFGYSLDHSTADRSTTTGTPHAFTRKYCAPEVSDYGPRNSKSDIFSLGCVFLEILFALHKGLVPSTRVKAYHDILEDGGLRPRLESFGSLGKIISNMLCTQPEDRSSAMVITSRLYRDEPNRFCAECNPIPNIKSSFEMTRRSSRGILHNAAHANNLPNGNGSQKNEMVHDLFGLRYSGPLIMQLSMNSKVGEFRNPQDGSHSALEPIRHPINPHTPLVKRGPLCLEEPTSKRSSHMSLKELFHPNSTLVVEGNEFKFREPNSKGSSHINRKELFRPNYTPVLEDNVFKVMEPNSKRSPHISLRELLHPILHRSWKTANLRSTNLGSRNPTLGEAHM